MRFAFTVLGVTSVAALASAGALAGTPQTYPQPVIGTSYAVSANAGSCVKVGDKLQVVNVIKNMTNALQRVNIFIYGIADSNAIGTPMMEGPTLDVNTAKSGLTPTSSPTVWLWSIALRPGLSVTQTLYVDKVPPGYYPANWDPVWGPVPWPMLYFGGTGYVRFSRSQVPLYAQIPYCTLDGSIPYTIPPNPGP